MRVLARFHRLCRRRKSFSTLTRSKLIRFQSQSSTQSVINISSHCGAVPKPKAISKGQRGKVGREFGLAGEDSFFLHHNTTYSQVCVGVADGVGNWSGGRTDAAHFAQTLMKAALSYTSDEESFQSVPNNVIPPYLILEHCCSATRDAVGASTICLANIDLLRSSISIVNLGDSGLAILRRTTSKKEYTICLKTIPQEQEFGVPKQLSSSSRSNVPEDADVLSDIELRKGDLVLLGTDGLWDNLFLEEIQEIVTGALRQFDDDIGIKNYVRKGDMTNRMIYEALSKSRDPRVDTPFSEHMTDVVGMIYRGGKPDDITCAVLYVH